MALGETGGDSKSEEGLRALGGRSRRSGRSGRSGRSEATFEGEAGLEGAGEEKKAEDHRGREDKEAARRLEGETGLLCGKRVVAVGAGAVVVEVKVGLRVGMVVVGMGEVGIASMGTLQVLGALPAMGMVEVLSGNAATPPVP